MSEVIDWSKAPEGWDVFIKGGFYSGFYRDAGDRYERENGYYRLKNDEAAYTVFRRPWSGEGLPPVGVVCEAKSMARGSERDWFKASVLYSSAYTIVLDDYQAGEFVAHPATLQFRPIRTPEQIAAGEREAAILDMERICRSGDFGSGGLAALYDAGYRKP